MTDKESLLTQAFSACKKGFWIVGVFSALINLLMLTVPLYMLQLFDRVLVGQSVETLVYLTIIAIIALLTMALLEVVRSRILLRISCWIERKLSSPALEKSLDSILAGSQYGQQSVKDILQLRQFLSSNAVSSLFDTPWVPLFIIVVFLLYPTLGVITLIGAILLTVISLYFIKYTQETSQIPSKLAITNQTILDKSLEHAETFEAMGLLPHLIDRWSQRNELVLADQEIIGNRSSILVSLAKFIRLVLQILILGVGAYFVIKGEITAGAMIASSIIMGRALAPIEQAMSSWKQAQSARQALQRLQTYFGVPNPRTAETKLTEVVGNLEVKNLVFIEPLNQKIILQGLSFSNEPGKILAIAGNSGSGKSTLARLILGIWPASKGEVRLEGASVYQWERGNFGKYTGYLSQEATLFPGSIKDNICRLSELNDEKIIEAAQFVEAHNLILKLENGYETQAKDYNLSGGQIRRIALARAFYGTPKLVVLDEPEANLDHEGLVALSHTLKRAKERKINVILISQNKELITYADTLLVLHEGKQQSFGPNSVN